MNKCRICGQSFDYSDLYLGHVCKDCLEKAKEEFSTIHGFAVSSDNMSVSIDISDFVDMVLKKREPIEIGWLDGEHFEMGNPYR